MPDPQIIQGKFKNGQYVGTLADAFYGYVQVKAIINNGTITDIQFLNYPQDPGFPMRGVVSAKPIVIEEFCWIGAGAIVVGGVTIGKGTVVGAGSVVTKSLPPMVVAAGNPCRVIRQLDDRPLPVLPPIPEQG